MERQTFKWKTLIILTVILTWLCGWSVTAEDGSNDNSLASLGILTEGAVVSPDFAYGVTEYDVTVPAGTQEIQLDPVPTNGNAWIVDITGTALTNGETTVEIIVSAANGEQYPYYLHVKEAAAQPPAVPETEAPQTEPPTETEPQTEDPRYVKVDRTALQDAENTIAALKDETRIYRDRSAMLVRILYGMIAFCVVLLFVVINLILKKKDLKAELQEYMGYGYPQDIQEEPADAPAGRERRARREEPEEPEIQPEPEPEMLRDDPATVPKPQKARKKAKRMPEYQKPQQQEYEYQKPDDSKAEDVEITMIDL